MDLPEESKTKKDFDFNKSEVKTKKNLKDLKFEET
jgi:hypothetical protein